jgi:hypothetical protein
MPGAQPRQSPVVRLASSARRGAVVPAGAPGVYRVPRVRTVTQSSDIGAAAATTSEWIQPEDTTETIGFARTRKSAFGPGATVGYDWTLGLQGAADGFQVSGPLHTRDMAWSPNTGNPSGTSEAQAQHSRYVGTFTYPQVAPDPGDIPPGMTVEYEAASGTPVGDATVSGNWRSVIVNALGELDGYGIAFYDAPVDDTFYTRAEVSALTQLFTEGGDVYNEGGAIDHDYSFTTTQGPIVALLVQANAVQNAVIYTDGANGGAWFLNSISATRTYTPPRYRFV